VIANPDNSAPFGTYALAPWRESLRHVADLAPATRLGRVVVSLVRKIALLGHSRGMNGPLDITVAKGVKARLFPASNRCEKRAFAGVQTWDSRERALLEKAIANHAVQGPFVFIDVGANVGLYTLFVNASARAHDCETHIISIEPDAENRARLAFNCLSSNCNAVIEPVAVAGTDGEGVLSPGDGNRGEIALLETGNGTKVSLETLASIVDRHGLDRIDAMKIDIEGHDYDALAAFYAKAEKSVWPRLVIAETNPPDGHRIAGLMQASGYTVLERTKLNAIFEHTGGTV